MKSLFCVVLLYAMISCALSLEKADDTKSILDVIAAKTVEQANVVREKRQFGGKKKS